MKMDKYKFIVESGPLGGSFPSDMLRYDQCEVYSKQDDGRVILVGPYKPTVGRWESFGWNVVECKVNK